jgi:Fe-S-cluster containining protein
MKAKPGQSKNGGLRVLQPKDEFRFACHDGLECFTRCCRDITIFLTPYDVLRLKNALGLSSESFLQDYTLTLVGDHGLPVVVLKMRDDETKSCPFVTDRGCVVYQDRPWSCRIYPLQPQASKITEKSGKKYYSVMDIPFCQGLRQTNAAIVQQWLEDQGITIYSEMEMIFNKITQNEFLSDKKIENKAVQQMYYMACYDLDRFRRFVFESSFLKQFDTDPKEIEKIKQDDVALYRFAMKWLEYGLIGQHGFKVKTEVIAAKKEQLGIS